MSTTDIHHILVPVDFSPRGECAIEYGALLADLFHAKLYLLHVIEGIHKYPHEWVMDAKPNTLQRVIRKKIIGKLAGYTEKLAQHDSISIENIIESGNPSHKIIEIAAQYDIDLIVMGTHGASGFEELFIGSNAHKVVNLSPCPVITIREGFVAPSIKTIVLPIDDSLHSRQKVNNLLPVAKSCGATVHILGITRSAVKSEVAKIKLKMETVEKLMKETGIPYTHKLVKGSNVAMETMGYAEEVNADMLAIMTDHESEMTGLFMGNFAQQIVNHSNIPVLSVHPLKSIYTYSG